MRRKNKSMVKKRRVRKNNKIILKMEKRKKKKRRLKNRWLHNLVVLIKEEPLCRRDAKKWQKKQVCEEKQIKVIPYGIWKTL